MEQDDYKKLLSEIEKNATEACTQCGNENWGNPITNPYLYGGKRTELDILMDYNEDELVQIIEQTVKYVMRDHVIGEGNECVMHARKRHDEIETTFKYE